MGEEFFAVGAVGGWVGWGGGGGGAGSGYLSVSMNINCIRPTRVILRARWLVCLQNVLLDAAGRAKVCDFGIARFKDRTFISTANGQAGTPAYMAPEIFEGGAVTEKVSAHECACKHAY